MLLQLIRRYFVFIYAATNVLIKRRCGCVDVFKCFCREDHKCLVKLADFDSVKPFQSKEFHGWHMEWWPYVRMSPEECEAVMGTPGYRAPEVGNHPLLLYIHY